MKNALLILFFFFSQLTAKEIFYCNLHEDEVLCIAYRAVDSAFEASESGLSSPFKYLKFDWQYDLFYVVPGCSCNYLSNYTSYKDRYEHVLWWCDYSMKPSTEVNEDSLKNEKMINDCYARWTKAKSALLNGLADVQEMFLKIYDDCISNHKNNLQAIYERGALLSDMGDFSRSVADIGRLIASGKVEEFIKDQAKFHFQLGCLLSEMRLYDQAIFELTKAIESNAENKEAYFERAVAYFENGDFSCALADYIHSDVHPTLIKANDTLLFDYPKMAKGICLGCLKGGLDSSIDFFPSLLSTAHGLGKGLWVFVSNPVGVSIELIESCLECVEFIKTNLKPELLVQLVPELRECLEKWDR